MVVRHVVHLIGTVQGVGFRPTVIKLAMSHGVSGWVRNGGGAAEIVCEGEQPIVDRFLRDVRNHLPPGATILNWSEKSEEPAGLVGFLARESAMIGDGLGVVPDRAPCSNCLAEMSDPTDRRFRYPFINCTDCGPRWTIVLDLPYDRERTSMRSFLLCADCAVEYGEPSSRRFHAEPIACPVCGPRLTLLDAGGLELARGEGALATSRQMLVDGKILVLKGVGGFQYCCRADDDRVVRWLRLRKGRPDKPFALMVSTIDDVKRTCRVSGQEQRLLQSPEAPIVLLGRRHGVAVAWSVAPRLRHLGMMLPSSPLHHLLIQNLGFPLVVTSANLSGEPICITDDEAKTKLQNTFSGFLTHDRDIVRPVDDSVVQVVGRKMQMVRRARGYSPMTLPTYQRTDGCIVGLGGHLKNTVALLRNSTVVVGQVVGDLDTVAATTVHRKSVADLVRLTRSAPNFVVADWHPDYRTTQEASQWPHPIIRIQHHHAHVAAAIAEYGLRGPVVGVAWDGLGLGERNELWGGEWLYVDGHFVRRIAHLRPIDLPGGERAHVEPWRCAVSVLVDLFSENWKVVAASITGLAPVRNRLDQLEHVLKAAVEPVRTTAAGRLFDAAAALLGCAVSVQSWEGQAAVELEAKAGTGSRRRTMESGRGGGHLARSRVLRDDKNKAPVVEAVANLVEAQSSPVVVDWRPAVSALVRGVQAQLTAGALAWAFHRDLSRLIALTTARFGVKNVVLVGGCFQNRVLATQTLRDLRLLGMRPFLPRLFPPGDSALAVGQVSAAAAITEFQGR